MTARKAFGRDKRCSFGSHQDAPGRQGKDWPRAMISGGATLGGILLSFLIAFGGCTGIEQDFSFAVVSDPHIGANPENERRLRACVDWIQANEAVESIEIVFVVGDIGFGLESLYRAKEILDLLSPPYIPLIGDNEVQSGAEEAFEEVFAPHFSLLAERMDRWRKAPTPVWNPQRSKFSFLQNYSFDHKGLHFICLDWCTRILAPLLGEQADLHDFPEGTWPWFVEHVTASAAGPKESLVLFSHHPMHAEALAAFTTSEYRTLSEFASGFQDFLYADFAGHYHIYWHETLWPAGYELFVTEAVSFLFPNLSLVEVQREGDRFSYNHRWITLLPAS